jgi:hypothetical protein
LVFHMHPLHRQKHSSTIFLTRLICLLSSSLEIWGGSHIVCETAFYNFDSLSVLAMDYFQEVVTSYLEALGKFFFYHYPIFFVILQVVRRCRVPNLYLEPCIYTLQLSSFYQWVKLQILWCLKRMPRIWISWHCANE